ncbi:MAG TPA: BrxA/BrxB family bacilliredoxin [Bacteroidota bacterium]|nr:BrxA/BrxB family bacilliredoxin [Bacteroidota bacterium]
MYNILMQQIKDEVSRLGVKELNTVEEVDNLLTKQKGTALVFVNSVCGCAGGIARPALALAMRSKIKPDVIASVFASGDREATAQARSYFTDMPSSSPSFALLRDGKLLHMIHRSDIEMREPREVAQMLTQAFEKYCSAEVKN